MLLQEKEKVEQGIKFAQLLLEQGAKRGGTYEGPGITGLHAFCNNLSCDMAQPCVRSMYIISFTSVHVTSIGVLPLAHVDEYQEVLDFDF